MLWFLTGPISDDKKNSAGYFVAANTVVENRQQLAKVIQDDLPVDLIIQEPVACDPELREVMWRFVMDKFSFCHIVVMLDEVPEGVAPFVIHVHVKRKS